MALNNYDPEGNVAFRAVFFLFASVWECRSNVRLCKLLLRLCRCAASFWQQV